MRRTPLRGLTIPLKPLSLWSTLGLAKTGIVFIRQLLRSGHATNSWTVMRPLTPANLILLWIFVCARFLSCFQLAVGQK